MAAGNERAEPSALHTTEGIVEVLHPQDLDVGSAIRAEAVEGRASAERFERADKVFGRFALVPVDRPPVAARVTRGSGDIEEDGDGEVPPPTDTSDP
jgi:hypothetical protein